MLTASIFTCEPISAQGAVPVPGTEQTNRHRCAEKEGYVGRAGLESVCEDIISNLSRLVATVRYEVVKKHRSRIPTDHGPWVGPHILLVFREMWDAPVHGQYTFSHSALKPCRNSWDDQGFRTCENSISKLSPAGTAEDYPGFRRGLFPAVPAGLVVLANPTQDYRPGLSSAVPTGRNS
jgi:hypothetical protein